MNNIGFFRYSGIASDKNRLWYTTELENYLMEVDIQCGEIGCLGKIPGTDGISYAYRGMVYHNGSIYLAPHRVYKLCIYNINDKEFSFFDFPEEIKMLMGEQPKCLGLILLGKEIFLYGQSRIVVKYNLETEIFKCMDLSKSQSYFRPQDWIVKSACVQDKIYFALDQYNIIYSVDPTDDSVVPVIVGKNVEQCSYSMIFMTNQGMCMVRAENSGRIDMKILADIVRGDILKSYNFTIPDRADNGFAKTPFLWGSAVGEYIVLILGHCNAVCVIDRNNADVDYFHIGINKLDKEDAWYLLYGVRLQDNVIATIVPDERQLLFIENGRLNKKKVELSKECVKAICEDIYAKPKRGLLIREQYESIDLLTYLDLLSEGKFEEKHE